MKSGIFPGWWQVAAAMILQAIASTSVYTAFSVVAVPLHASFEPSRMVLMLCVTAATLAGGLISPPLGAAIDRFSVRLILLAGIACGGTGFLLLSMTTAMWQVIAIYFVFMSTAAVILGPLAISALLSRWFVRRRGLAIGIAASGTAIGGLLIPPLLQYMIDTMEWRNAMRVYGIAIVAVMAPVAWLIVVDRPGDRGLNPDGDADRPADAPKTALPTLTNRDLLRNPDLWLLSLIIAIAFGGQMGIVSNLMPFVIEKGITPEKGALLISVLSGANFVGKLACASLADRINFRMLLGAILLVLGIGTFAFLKAEAFAMQAGAAAIIGIGGGGMLPLWSVIVANVFGANNVGRTFGLMQLFIMPVMLFVAPLFGHSYDATGAYDLAYLGYIVSLGVALVLLTRVGGGRRPQPVVSSTSV